MQCCVPCNGGVRLVVEVSRFVRSAHRRSVRPCSLSAWMVLIFCPSPRILSDVFTAGLPFPFVPKDAVVIP